MNDIPRNSIRTVEIEVCGECQEDVKESHYFVCPQCLRQRCKNTAQRFTVDVSFTKPHGYPRKPKEIRTLYPGWETGKEPQFSFHGSFCYECGERIQQILKAAGLNKSSTPQSRQ